MGEGLILGQPRQLPYERDNLCKFIQVHTHSLSTADMTSTTHTIHNSNQVKSITKNIAHYFNDSELITFPLSVLEKADDKF